MKGGRQADSRQTQKQEESGKELVQQCGGLTAKEYLQQLYRADTILSQKMIEKEELRTEITRMERAGSLYRYPYSAGEVMRLLILEAQVDRMAEANARLRHEVICQIHELQNADRIKVLYKRYVRFEKFEQIAADLHYSIRNIYTIHGQALREFQRKCMKPES
ncbi:MAG: hypothetical protein HFH34_12885 [Eubacterium sp.]|nr:hypothetical protein [Eubacterium sp.]